MAGDHSTYYNTTVDLASYSNLAVGDYLAARETDVACDRSPNRCRSGSTADQFRLKRIDTKFDRASFRIVPKPTLNTSGVTRDRSID
jgi:hypothetical protein